MFTEEIRQNVKLLLATTVPDHLMKIFDILVGKNLKGKEYEDYINNVATPSFTRGKVEFYRNGVRIASGTIK